MLWFQEIAVAEIVEADADVEAVGVGSAVEAEREAASTKTKSSSSLTSIERMKYEIVESRRRR